MAEQNPIVELLGESVSKGSGEVNVTSFTGEGKVLGLYFSAHWCPPCRAFTPVLSQWYKDFKKTPNGDNFEIVFISSDKDDSSFVDYYKEMPWLALPYSKREMKSKLSSRFKVTGIPTLIFLDAENGAQITTEGRSIVMEDREGQDFPWKPKPFTEIIAGKFVNGKGDETTWDELQQGKCIGIYFSAHWCGPCRAFTPNLVKTYNKIKEAGKNFEIIFASSDKDEDQWQSYFDTMPWLSLPFGDKRKKQLTRLFDVSGIPTLVILDENGKVITANGRGAVTIDPEGTEFPWYPKPVNKLSGQTAGDINDSPALIWFVSDSDKDSDKEEQAKKTLYPLAKEHIEKYKDLKELIFFYALDDDDSDIVESLREFCKLPEKTKLAIVDIPQQKVYGFDDDQAEITSEVIQQFIDKYVGDKLDSHKIGN